MTDAELNRLAELEAKVLAEGDDPGLATVELSGLLLSYCTDLIAAARRERALREAAASVVADYDRAKSYKYDEIKWAEFKGVDPLLAALSPNPAPAEPTP